MRYFLPLLVLVLLFSCSEEKPMPKTGMWRTILEVQDGKKLPFIFEWREDRSLVIHNADERVEVTDVRFEGDSITITHPVFEGVFKGVYSEEKVSGNFIKPSLDRVVPFSMVFGNENRFEAVKTPQQDVTGTWETVFSAHSEEDRYIAKGIFEQAGDKVTGTFRTTTGDYRYLEGVMDGNTMKLSTFDGAHAFLFEAEVKDSILYGFFYSGNHWKEPFSAKRNAEYELPDANDLTYLKEGYDRFDFSFPDVDGTMVSLSDERFKDKVVVVQIMGTWCPNCLEETQYYTEYLKSNPNKDLEFISLAFEYATTKERAIKGIEKLKSATGVPYPILLAQYGTSSKEEAQKKLPMLNHVLSYPTTIFIDVNGEVRRIHTGFNGKATGNKFEEFKNKFESLLTTLLQEQPQSKQ